MKTFKAPLIAQFMTLSPHEVLFHQDQVAVNQMSYNDKQRLNLNKDGRPAYLALYKSPPTNCFTPGKMLPGGYTKSGKYKSPRWSPAKTDKRAGK